MSAVKNMFKQPKLPEYKAPSTPVMADDPAALAARAEALKKGRGRGYASMILAPLGEAAPATQLKQVLGA